MHKLLNKYKEIKRTRKGFTLVELLVVIAILAVLASVSVVGYLGFTTKARNSNAMTELAQVREVIRAELIDGDTNYYKWDSTGSKATEVTEENYNDSSDNSSTKFNDGFTLTYNASGSTKTINYATKGSVSETWSNVLKSAFNDLVSLNGTLFVDVTTGTDTASGTISTIAYVIDGGSAKWTIDTDELTQGVGNTASDNYAKNKTANNVTTAA